MMLTHNLSLAMKRRNFLILIVLAFLACISIYFFIQNRQIAIENDQNLQEKREKIAEIKKMNDELNEKLSKIVIPDIIGVDGDSVSHHLSDLVSLKPKLIFRYSELHCSYCYDAELALLKEYFPEEEQNVAILCSYQQRRHFLDFISKNDIKLPIYRIYQEAFDWTLETYGTPYYFVLHPNLMVSHIYIRNNDFPELNRQYLRSVKRFLSE